MTDSSWQRIETLFFDALDRPKEDRSRFLTEACGDDAELRVQVQSMLDAHEDDGKLDVEERLLAAEDKSTPGTMVGKTIGPYRIVELLGRGGMGDVYLAERGDEQYEHRVALKLIRPGMRAEEVTARFLQERQILAQLEHPNIATLLDGGVTVDGQPYLVMQYVDGQPITDYCDKNALDVRQRLALFRTVCQAVHVAHTNLVVHRDLKPANILVTQDGHVKLLDFGIAKLLDPTVPAETRPLDRVMTPEHAAPEQVAGDAVTTATDVYALGVLLYQLLAGRRPIEFSTTSPSEIERVVRDVEPEPPSTADAPHAKELRGELDNIVMMALRKEPDRRYPSALEFSNDIERYIGGQPVRAQRDTAWYRTRKFLARNFVAVAVTLGVVALTAGFAITTAVQSRRIAAQRDRAELEQAKSERIVSVLSGLLTQSNPVNDPGGDTLRVRDLIVQIEAEVQALDDQPAVQARLRELLGDVYHTRSGYAKAKTLYNDALVFYEGETGAEADAVRVYHALALVVQASEGTREAQPMLRESLRRTRALYGESDREVGVVLQVLAGSLIEDDPDEAMELLDEAVAINRAHGTENNMNAAAIANQLGIYYLKGLDFDRAAANFRTSADILRVLVGDDHPHVLVVRHNLAATVLRCGDWAEAEEIERDVLERRTRILGAETTQTARSWELLATAQAHHGRLDEALQAYRTSMDIFATTHGIYSHNVSNAARNVGSVLSLQGEYIGALTYLDSSIAIDFAMEGKDAYYIANKRCARAFTLFLSGQRDQALADGRRAVNAVDQLTNNEQHRYRADAREPLAVMLIATDEAGEAETLLRFAIEQRTAMPPRSPERAAAYCMLAVSLSKQGRVDDARQLLEANYAAIESWGLLSSLHQQLLDETLRSTGLSTN